MIRIAISQRVVSLEDRAERRDVLDQAWTAILFERGWLAVPIPSSLPDPARFLSELRIDGVVLSGGNDLGAVPGARDVAPERDRLEARLLDACTERNLPLFGVCRGLHHLVLHYGGRITPVRGHAGSEHPVTARADLLPLADRAEVNSFHDFGVLETGVGPELAVAAVAPDGSVEAVAHRSRPQWAIQWHPERPPEDPRDLDLMAALFEGRR